MKTAKSDSIGLPTGQLYRGERIGKYEVLTQLSVGGMAELFLAFTQGPGGFRKFVVIKRILPDAKSNDSFVKMFLDEARITAALSHPNIGQVYELGDERDGLYLSMEFLAGQNLNQITSACLKAKKRMPIGFCVAVAHDLCLALHYAHTFVDPSAGLSPVIHRDVAQKNVMVTYDGVVKLLDFGIAKAKANLGKTSVGMVKGTTGYMSPEQVRGEALDARSDLFSVGVVLFECLTGKRLFSAPSESQEMERILRSRIPDPTGVDPAISRGLSQVVMKALSRNREDRYPTAKAMAKALEQTAGDVLYDQERLAAFMRELFESKMRATRELLDSAGKEERTQIRAAAKSLTEDHGATFPGEQVETGPAHRAAPASPPPPPPPSDPRLPAFSIPQVASEPTTVRSSLYWVVALVVVMLLAAAALFAAAGFLAPAPPGSLGAISDEVDPATLPPTDPRNVNSRPGTVTLITDRVSEVKAGPQSLGKTPLINVQLPAGDHLLTILGPDGVRRVLKVAIRPGQNTAVQVRLADLPEGSR